MFDATDNLWSGQNWLPGSQSGVNKSIGGGDTLKKPKFQTSDGAARSRESESPEKQTSSG